MSALANKKCFLVTGISFLVSVIISCSSYSKEDCLADFKKLYQMLKYNTGKIIDKAEEGHDRLEALPEV